ncbi:MAG: DNA-3-methyladenine glycosylase, partial [Vampirovibrionales bacterium]|nr:DNA-3-methyladenine glycosylase [Vampirovibrionales bacterium]
FCTRGPGKLCNALQITKADYNEKSMMSPDSDLLLVQATQPALPAFIQASPRIGIRHAQAVLWRFFEINNPWVSLPPGSRYRTQGKLF